MCDCHGNPCSPKPDVSMIEGLRMSCLSRRCSGCSWFVGLCSILIVPDLCADEQADLLTVVRAGHRSARESIRTFSATVTDEVTQPQKQVHTKGKYWRSLDVARAQQQHSGSSFEDYLLKGSEVRQVGRHRRKNGGQYYAAVRRPRTEMFCGFDPWLLMHLEFGGPGGRVHMDYDQFLDSAKERPRVSRDTAGGRESVRVEMSYDLPNGGESRVTIWHDVGRSYLVWKGTSTSSDESLRNEVEIVEFLESAPGVVFPVKRVVRSFRGSDLIGESTTTLSDVRINEPIPKDVFRLPTVPAGTILQDYVEGKQYPIDEDWRPAGPAKPLTRMVVANPSDKDDAGYTSPSTEEPASWTRWLLPGSLAILGLAGGFSLYRRYRARASVPA
jgi:hypothetical protein